MNNNNFDKAKIQTTAKHRESNFELLRIIAMLMIVGSHLACHGVQRVLEGDLAFVAYKSGSITNRIFTNFLQPLGDVGVALFFMITGYFLCKKTRTSIKKVALESAFYSFLFGIAFAVMLAISKLIDGGGNTLV